MKNLFKKLKALFFVPSPTLEDHINNFKAARAHHRKTGELDIKELTKAIKALKAAGFTLQQLIDMEPDPEKRYTKEEDSNVLTLH